MSRLSTFARPRTLARLRSHLPRMAAWAALVALSGCASLPPQPDDASLQREAMAGTHAPVPAPLPLNNDRTTTTSAATLPQVSRGSGQFVHATGLATPRPTVAGANGVTFNFENQPVQAVVKAILGDLLKKNYTIVPGVQGNISFSTAEPVEASQALPILETLLSWTNNAVVERNGGYVVLPAKDAVGGNLVPSLGAAAPAGGLQARLFPLHYIAAAEMQKLIKPFARPDAVLLVDSARNVIVMAGTPEELANYQRTVRTFDVDWLRGMSVGVFSLQHADVDQLMPKLDEMFGSKGDTPLAGMLRFIPIKRTNALVVISTQPNYVDEVGNWIARIDQGGGNQPQLYVYDVRNIKASDLAKYLAQIYASGSGGGDTGSAGGEVGPGLSAGTLGSADNARGSASGMGSTAGSFGSSNTAAGGGLGGVGGGVGGLGGSGGNGLSGGMGNRMGGMTGGAAASGSYGAASAASQDHQYTSQDGSIRIGSVDANNQLLVRARPSQWSEIEAAIKRLDTIPLQVQIETRILEVSLTGQFQFGVQWYLQGLTGSTTGTDANGNVTITPGQPYRHRQVALGGGGNAFGGEPLFYSFLNSQMQVAVRAMEDSGNTKTLSAPSLVVMNNQPAMIQVGNNVPINQNYIVPGLGTSGGAATTGSVSYLTTGVILKVVPRVNPGGLVYLDVSQEVSTPTTQDKNGNYTIADRSMQTEVAVQSGQTVLLGGLIQQNDSNDDNGIPGLNRVPILGRLFGTTSRNRSRTELIVLITPRVIRNSEEARQITDDYQREFESLKPLRAERAAKAAKATDAAATVPTPLRH